MTPPLTTPLASSFLLLTRNYKEAMNLENKELLAGWARALAAGELTIDDFLHRVGGPDGHDPATGRHQPKSVALDEVTLDLDRANRCGFPEVIYGEGKTSAAIVQTVEHLVEARQGVLVTRLTLDKASPLTARFPAGIYHPRARTFRLAPPAHDSQGNADSSSTGTSSPPPGQVALITAGTSDLPVAEEARETLLWMGITPTWIQDVGVAGPHRLREKLELFHHASAVIVVAGMEGALPSVVGGYASCPVIAVPTSVGYGAALGGITPLLGMLNSCAANVTVVNIDAGFKGAYVAGLIARQSRPRCSADTTTAAT
jgi:pyridinium-3,5-biscarboxylic acid mononucleotide synthase